MYYNGKYSNGGVLMNKKILALLSLFVIITGMSAVAAFDLNDVTNLFGGDNKNIVTVSGIDFNIPDGFKEVSNASVDNIPADNPYVDYNISSKLFNDSKDGFIELSVSESDNFTVNDDAAKVASINGTKTTINGVEGYEFSDSYCDGFTYAKDGKLVIISVSDKELIKDIVIA